MQLVTFGRLLDSRPDQLPGYRLAMLAIDDVQVVATSGKTHHPIVAPSTENGARVEGMVYQITEQELAAADAYEVADYKRVEVGLASGMRAWVYVQA